MSKRALFGACGIVMSVLAAWSYLAQIAPDLFQIRGKPLVGWLWGPNIAWLAGVVAVIWFSWALWNVASQLEKQGESVENIDGQLKRQGETIKSINGRLERQEKILRGPDSYSFVQADGGTKSYPVSEFMAMSNEGRERIFATAPELKAEWAMCLLGKIESEQARRDEAYSAWLKSKEGQISTWANRIADDLKSNFEGFKKTNTSALEDVRVALTARVGVMERKLSIGPKSPGDTFVLRSGAGPITRKEIDAMPDADREGLFGQNAGMRQWWEA